MTMTAKLKTTGISLHGGSAAKRQFSYRALALIEEGFLGRDTAVRIAHGAI